MEMEEGVEETIAETAMEATEVEEGTLAEEVVMGDIETTEVEEAFAVAEAEASSYIRYVYRLKI